MKTIFCISLFFQLISFSMGSLATADVADTPVVVKVSLYPMGSFDATSSRVLGKGFKKGDVYAGKEFRVAVDSLKTGMSLRDKHLKEKLNYKKHKFIIVRDVKAKGSDGVAKLKVMNVEKPIRFKFKDLGKNKAQAQFKIKLKDYKIDKISYQGVGVEDEVTIIATLPYENK